MSIDEFKCNFQASVVNLDQVNISIDYPNYFLLVRRVKFGSKMKHLP